MAYITPEIAHPRDAETLAAWDLGTQVAMLQAKGIRDVTSAIAKEEQVRESSDKKLTEALLAFTDKVDRAFSQVNQQMADLQARLEAEVAAREAAEQKLVEESLIRKKMLADEQAAREAVREELLQALAKEEQKRREQDMFGGAETSALDERMKKLESSNMDLSKVGDTLKAYVEKEVDIVRARCEERVDKAGEHVAALENKTTDLDTRIAAAEKAHVAYRMQTDKNAQQENELKKAKENTQEDTNAKLSERIQDMQTSILRQVEEIKKEAEQTKGEVYSKFTETEAKAYEWIEMEKGLRIKMIAGARQNMDEALVDMNKLVESARLDISMKQKKIHVDVAETVERLTQEHALMSGKVEECETAMREHAHKIKIQDVEHAQLKHSWDGDVAAREIIERRMNVMTGKMKTLKHAMALTEEAVGKSLDLDGYNSDGTDA
eukprot:gene14934-17652_t